MGFGWRDYLYLLYKVVQWLRFFGTVLISGILVIGKNCLKKSHRKKTITRRPSPPMRPLCTHYGCEGRGRPSTRTIDARVSATTLLPVPSTSATYHAQCMRDTWRSACGTGGEWGGSFRPVILGRGESAGHDPSSSTTPRATHGETGDWPEIKTNEAAKETSRGHPL